MKKLILLGALALIAVNIMGAAPANNSAVNAAATDTVGAQHTATAWKHIDSIVVQLTDTCDVIYTYSGSAVLDPGQKLWIGFVDATGATANTSTLAPTVDTAIYEWSQEEPFSKTFKIGITFYDSLYTQTDRYDTIYVTAAVKSAENVDEVIITNGRLSCMVADKN